MIFIVRSPILVHQVGCNLVAIKGGKGGLGCTCNHFVLKVGEVVMMMCKFITPRVDGAFMLRGGEFFVTSRYFLEQKHLLDLLEPVV